MFKYKACLLTRNNEADIYAEIKTNSCSESLHFAVINSSFDILGWELRYERDPDSIDKLVRIYEASATDTLHIYELVSVENFRKLTASQLRERIINAEWAMADNLEEYSDEEIHDAVEEMFCEVHDYPKRVFAHPASAVCT